MKAFLIVLFFGAACGALGVFIVEANNPSSTAVLTQAGKTATDLESGFLKSVHGAIQNMAQPGGGGGVKVDSPKQ